MLKFGIFRQKQGDYFEKSDYLEMAIELDGLFCWRM